MGANAVKAQIALACGLAGKALGGGDHPEREVVVWDLQLHRTLEQLKDRRAELSAGEELDRDNLRSPDKMESPGRRIGGWNSSQPDGSSGSRTQLVPAAFQGGCLGGVACQSDGFLIRRP